MTQLAIAVVGAGMIGRRHIEEIQQNSECTVSAIVDPFPGAAELAAQFGVKHYASLDALFAAESPDGVVLATPNHLHMEQALQCIAAGVAVLVEKPLAHSLAEGERLVAAAETANARLLVGHHRLHSPILHKAMEVVKSGILGDIVGVMGSAVFHKPDVGYYDPPFEWRRLPGAGPILVNMIHEVGSLRAMMGEIVAVQAFASNAIRGFQVEDTAAINLRFANGALGSFLLSDTAACPKSWEQTSQEDKAFASYADQDAYVITGTNGSLAVPTMRLHHYAKPEERTWNHPFQIQTLALQRADPLARQIEHFAALIRGEVEPLVTGRDGLQNLRVVDAIARAASSGAVVEVALD